MPIDLDQLKHQSKIAAVLTALSSTVVLASLLFSFIETNHARTRLNEIQAETNALTSQRDSLKGEVAQYSVAVRNLIASPGVSRSSVNAALSLTPSIAAQIPRISIKIADTRDRNEANTAAQVLQSNGYIVPDIEVTPGSNSTHETTVRYFQHDPKTVSGANDIVKILKSAGFDVRPEFDDEFVGGSTAPPPGTFEFWIGSNPSYTQPVSAPS